jgi:ribosomal-protein-alanine N-acetyltransferase
MNVLRPYFLMTERLGFGHWCEDDLDLALSLWGDERTTALIGGPFGADEVAARLAVEIALRRSAGVQYWPVFLLKTGELAGCAGLRPYRGGMETPEFGVHLRPGCWGQGIGREAAEAVVRIAFETPGVEGVVAGHHPENRASERLLLGLGFRRTHEELYVPTGRIHPHYRLDRVGS